MSGYKVEICGVNTAKLPLLTTEEKEELFKRILAGDKQAREDYIKGNLRLVLSVIQRFSGNNENVDDLFQIGCIGLIKAIDNFDITQNVRFSTYAVPMILGEVRQVSPGQQFHPCQPLPAGHCLQSYLRQRKSHEKKHERTHHHGNCR